MSLEKVIVLLLIHVFLCAQVQAMEGHKKKGEEEGSPRREQRTIAQERRETREKLSPEEQQAVNRAFLEAVQEKDEEKALQGVKKALDQGANIKASPGVFFFNALIKGNWHVARYLVEQGMAITKSNMEYAAGFVDIDHIRNLINFGGVFVEAQDLMLDQVIDLFDEESGRDARVLLWLLLRASFTKKTRRYLKEALKQNWVFMMPDLHQMSIRERLTPLLIALILSRQDEAKRLIEDLAVKHHLSDGERRAIDEALIFGAAHGNGEIIKIIFENFGTTLTNKVLDEALEAAALQGETDALALVEIKLSRIRQRLEETAHEADVKALRAQELGLIPALENALMIAAAQMHENMVSLILDLDREEGLNLNLVPIIDRLDLLVSEDVSQERKDRYMRLLTILSDYLHSRYSQMIALRSQPTEQEVVEPTTGALIPQLPTELILRALNFLRPRQTN